jgi:hypothetical protein
VDLASNLIGAFMNGTVRIIYIAGKTLPAIIFSYLIDFIIS